MAKNAVDTDERMISEVEQFVHPLVQFSGFFLEASQPFSEREATRLLMCSFDILTSLGKAIMTCLSS